MRWYVKEFGPASKVAVSGAQAATACFTPEEVVVELSGTAQQSSNKRISDAASVMIGLIKSYCSFGASSCGLLVIVSIYYMLQSMMTPYHAQYSRPSCPETYEHPT